MAITGTGTEQDPFIVHSYDEIKTAFESHDGSTTMYYSKLANDIDCNDYGVDFQWETLTLGNGSGSSGERRANTLDLDGHTIKNALVKNNNNLFATTLFAPASYGVIKNGKILNIFCANAPSNVFYTVTLQDVSLSIDGNGITTNIFNGVTINNCAIHVELTQLLSAVFESCIHSNTDIELSISDKNQTLVFSNGSVTDCRIRGKISGAATLQSNNYIVLGYYNLNGGVNCTFTNCVIDIDASEMTYSISGPEFTMICPFNNAGYNTNAICKSEFPSGTPIPNVWNYMTHSEIRNGDTLRAKGFTVINVEG